MNDDISKWISNIIKQDAMKVEYCNYAIEVLRQIKNEGLENGAIC